MNPENRNARPGKPGTDSSGKNGMPSAMSTKITAGGKNPTPDICSSKIPHLIHWERACVVCVGSVVLSLPAGGLSLLLSACSGFSSLTCSGVLLIASLLWSSRRTLKNGCVEMRLTTAAARSFVDRVGGCSTPATFVAKAWGCKQLTRGCNVNGKVTNTWRIPDWCNGSSEKITVHLTPHQLRRWNRRGEILRERLDDANPHAALVRKTLMVTMPGPAFDGTARKLTEDGELRAVSNYRKHPHRLNVTRDVDVQSNVSRLPEPMRETLQISGQTVAEFDVKSAHAVLLGMLYKGETGAEWAKEKARFADQVLLGFPSIYGERKQWKVDFLSALNQRTRVARHASEGYREFERLFPLLAEKAARMKWRNKNAVGRLLRCEMAKIQKQLLIENHADGIPSIPVVDSAVVAMPEGIHAQHRAAFRTAWRLGAPIAELTGTAPRIEGSNGENFRFFL